MSNPVETDASGTRQAMQDVLERLSQGFAGRDLRQVLELFAPDPEIVFIGSEADELAIGPARLRALLEALFARPETYRWHWRRLHVAVAGELAWLTTEATLLVEGNEQLELPYRITLVLRRRDDGWLIVQYHGSEPATAPEP